MAKIAFSERAWAEYLYWQSERSPFEGIGKPEALVGNLSSYEVIGFVIAS